MTSAALAIGLILTASLAFTAHTVNRRNEDRLLLIQGRQAGALVSATVQAIRDPLAAALQTAEATGGDPDQFARAMAPSLGPSGLFVSASLWRVDASGARQLTTTGAAPQLAPTAGPAVTFVRSALTATTFVVTGTRSGTVEGVAFAIAARDPLPLVVYAERVIPANRQVPIEADSAFADLDFATYLGTTPSLDALTTTNVPPSRLPLTGSTTRQTIPFGNTSVLLMAKAHGQLGGSIGPALPWIILFGGLVLTLGSATLAERLVRRRRDAERDAHIIIDLYAELDVLYAQQRSIAQSLQQALLPAFNPEIPSVQVASRYAAGAQGVDVGGDWYSVVRLDETHFAFVVGDVSGRGISAATVMARLRFTIRAYLVEGHTPDRVLQMCAPHLDIQLDHHFATVLVGLADVTTRVVSIANAGHLTPLLVAEGSARFVPTRVGPPLGTTKWAYESTTFEIPPGATLFMFTDGLVERRGESITTSLDRLAHTAAAAASRPEGGDSEPSLDDFLSNVLAALTTGGEEDDIAMLALRFDSRQLPTGSMANQSTENHTTFV